ncbi:hypothetical protein C9427_17640 [Mesorhizobium helmanticense]|uniref:Uncharacterized protein n=1 Tax=Mesorhizobium helmanticense TaxID=1776423 RepID=A0A2T4IUL3_9HYPH|nr:hypothetical protein C9427_17640 [Mesorhizobium helmanticense]
MSAVFMVADNRIGFAPLSTANVSDIDRFRSIIASSRLFRRKTPFQQYPGWRQSLDKLLKKRQTI